MINKPLLIDLDGVLRIGNSPAHGLQDFLSFIDKYNINSCILSNSSLYSSNVVYNYFEDHSIKVKIPIITAIDSAHQYVSQKYKRVAVFCDEKVKPMFKELLDYQNPEAVLIGDIGNEWNYKIVQQIFEFVQNGTELIAIHKNKFWNKPNVGTQLDAGPFIHAIEFATSSQATLIGKPSNLYFRSALNLINANEQDPFVMVGDDLDSDMTGASKLDAETILIYTGKTKKPFPNIYKPYVNYTANNLYDVIKILKNLNTAKG